MIHVLIILAIIAGVILAVGMIISICGIIVFEIVMCVNKIQDKIE